MEVLAPGVVEVESDDESGETYAMLPRRADQLLDLTYRPLTVS